MDICLGKFIGIELIEQDFYGRLIFRWASLALHNLRKYANRTFKRTS